MLEEESSELTGLIRKRKNRNKATNQNETKIKDRDKSNIDPVALSKFPSQGIKVCNVEKNPSLFAKILKTPHILNSQFGSYGNRENFYLKLYPNLRLNKIFYYTSVDFQMAKAQIERVNKSKGKKKGKINK